MRSIFNNRNQVGQSASREPTNLSKREPREGTQPGRLRATAASSVAPLRPDLHSRWSDSRVHAPSDGSWKIVEQDGI